MAVVVPLSGLSQSSPFFRWRLDVPGTPQAVAFSKDGKAFFIGNGDSSIREYDANTGALVRQVTGLPGPVGALAVSPDGQYLASSSFVFEGGSGPDHTIHLWHTADLSPVTVLSGHTSSVLDVDFSPDGQYLVSAGDDTTVRVWRVSDWTLSTTQIVGQFVSCMRARFIPGRQQIATVDFVGNLRLWSAPGLSPLGQLNTFRSSFLGAFAVSPDGNQALVSSFNGVSWVDLNNLTQVQTTTKIMQGYDAVFSSSGHTALIVGLPFTSTDPTLEVWNAVSKSLLVNLVLPDGFSTKIAMGCRRRPGVDGQFGMALESLGFGSGQAGLAQIPDFTSGVRK